MKVLRDVLIEAGELNRYFDGRVPVTVWRAKKKHDPVVFDLVEEAMLTARGPRQADITIEAAASGEKWVRVKPSPRGASTFDKPNVFKGSGWEYYRLQAGTQLPLGIAIVRDNFNPRFQATHFTIAPAFDMPLSTFRGLLQQLATGLVREVG
jgi:hypothetical protein